MQNKTLPFLVSALFVCCASGADPAKSVKAPDAERVTLGVQLAAREACELVDKLPPAPEVAQAKEYCSQSKWAREALPAIVASIKSALKQIPAATEDSK